MREISPALNLTAEEFFSRAPPAVAEIIRHIRTQKEDGSRLWPSAKLEDRSSVLTSELRQKLLDAVAALVDENLCGRSEMCFQFASLLQQALTHLDVPARAAVGWSIYYRNGREIFRWPHAWVRVGDEIIDGNVDSLAENPVVPTEVNIAPYWGPISTMPNDRKLREEFGGKLPQDKDVSEIWWPELRALLNALSGEESNNAFKADLAKATRP